MQFEKKWEKDRLISVSQAIFVFSRIAKCRVRHLTFWNFLRKQNIEIKTRGNRSYVFYADIERLSTLWPSGKCM